MIFKTRASKQYWTGILIGAIVVMLRPLTRKIPFLKTPNLMLDITFPLLGGVFAGFIVKKGLIGSMIAGFLALMLNAAMLSIMGAIIIQIQGGFLDFGVILSGTLEYTLLLAIPSIIGGMVGGIARMIFEKNTQT